MALQNRMRCPKNRLPLLLQSKVSVKIGVGKNWMSDFCQKKIEKYHMVQVYPYLILDLEGSGFGSRFGSMSHYKGMGLGLGVPRGSRPIYTHTAKERIGRPTQKNRTIDSLKERKRDIRIPKTDVEEKNWTIGFGFVVLVRISIKPSEQWMSLT
ncbi:hypothetical protein M9H77_21452 [Catharanthus roseus]|uniref:Uncharacterized protein n=1 Tax=Catharanthus roseus TaxID=4058 RepID=A0ACC0APP1_CATRO|nr:hypothetical protein M9H77_21452 [Catharanthus roseus]